MVVMNIIIIIINYGKLFADELTEQLLEAGFIQSKFQLSIYYKYAPYGSKTVVLSYFDDCVYWYKNEYIGKWFVDTLGKRFHVNFLGYADWFMSIIISQIKDHSISVDQARYATSIVDVFQPKTGCLLSFSGMQRKLFIDRRNRTNSH